MPLTGTELILVAVCFSVAIWNTSVGPSGAVTFATMATLLPPAAVVPIHAIVEAGAGISRTWLLRQFVDWRVVFPFIAGGILGLSVAAPLLNLNLLSHDVLRTLLGATILTIAWLPLPALGDRVRTFSSFSGLGTSFLTLFVGATGPLVNALMGRSYQDHRQVLGTSSACMLFQHAAKIPIFVMMGFSFLAFTKLLILLLLAITAGTWVGRQVLIKVPQHIIKPVFKGLITILGLNLMWQGILNI
ncbi:MAG: TSUP family transporter [Pseudomonadales bacterium]